MPDPSPRQNPEALLAHGPFLRGLARALLFDAALAEDAVQETWVAALRRGPQWGSDPRPWLAAVTRNLALRLRRGEGRRVLRERAAARPEGLPSTAEIVEREAARREVVEAVLALEEPCRSAVLLRYLEELPLRQVARRLGVPVETARTRIKRGLARLRRALDEKHGNERGAWCALLVPIALGKKGGLLPAAKEVLGAAPAKAGLAAALLVGSAAILRPVEVQGSPGGGGQEERPRAVVAAIGIPRIPVWGEGAREATPPDSPARGGAVAKERAVSGRVLDDRGVAVSGAQVEFDGIVETTDAAGRFELSATPPVRIRAYGSRHFEAALDLRPGQEEGPEIRLDRALFVHGVVRDSLENPVEGARVRASVPAPESGEAAGGAGWWGEERQVAVSDPAAADGSFLLGPLRPGRYTLRGWASMDSDLGPLAEVDLVVSEDRGGVVMQALEGTIWIRGKAKDCETGEALPRLDLAWDVFGPGRSFGRLESSVAGGTFGLASWSRASLSLPPRRVLLGARAEGFETRFLDLQPRREALSSVSLCLSRPRPGTGEIEARVSFDDGLPYEGLLAIETWRPGEARRLEALAVDGVARVPGLEPGDLAAHPVLPDSVALPAETTRLVRIDPGSVASVAWTIPRGGEVRVTALDGERVPVRRFTLVLENDERELRAEGEAGEARLRGVPPGTYRAHASADGLAEAVETLLVERGGIAQAVLVLPNRVESSPR
jgi:RNA polymerase sigma factor (sigma-70 family)